MSGPSSLSTHTTTSGTSSLGILSQKYPLTLAPYFTRTPSGDPAKVDESPLQAPALSIDTQELIYPAIRDTSTDEAIPSSAPFSPEETEAIQHFIDELQGGKRIGYAGSPLKSETPLDLTDPQVLTCLLRTAMTRIADQSKALHDKDVEIATRHRLAKQQIDVLKERVEELEHDQNTLIEQNRTLNHKCLQLRAELDGK